MAWSPDGKQVASGCLDNTVKIWQTSSGTWDFPESGWPSSVSWDFPERSWPSSVSQKHSRAFSKQLFLCMLTDLNAFRGVTAVTWSPDGKSLAAVSYLKSVWIWDTLTGQVKWTLNGHSHSCNCTFLEDGRYGHCYVIKADPTCPKNGHSGYVTAVSYSCLFSNVWCVLTIEHFTGLSGVFLSVQMASKLPVAATTTPSKSGSCLVSFDDTVKIWQYQQASHPSFSLIIFLQYSFSFIDKKGVIHSFTGWHL